MPGGVSSPVRAFGAVGGTPLVHPAGARCGVRGRGWQRAIVDFVQSWGPLILGHAHPEVVEAIARGRGRGTSFGAPREPEIELAERIVAATPASNRCGSFRRAPRRR